MAQYSQGTTGLLTIPTADMQPDGTFMVGVNFMPKGLTPSVWDYNTANYFFNFTFLSSLEVNYLCTLLRLSDGVLNQDRALAIRLRAIKEARWYPSVVVGTNDALSLSQDNYNPFESVDANRYYGAVFAVLTKHFEIYGEHFGITMGYNYTTQRNVFRDGLFYGVSYSPQFYTDLKLMADVNNDMVSMGAAIRLFKRFVINVFCYDFKTCTGGVRYEVKLY